MYDGAVKRHSHRIASTQGAARARGDRRRGDERRRSPRQPLVATVLGYPDDDPTPFPRLFLSQDVSARGMAILRPGVDAELGESTQLELAFELPGGGFVRARARVTSDGPGGRWRRTGLEFVALEIGDQKKR
jgi:hypothetical protein